MNEGRGQIGADANKAMINKTLNNSTGYERVSRSSLWFNLNNLKILQSLPLLESFCWNIKNPYSLSPETMLAISEERWQQKDILRTLKTEERNFIHEISELFGGLPLIDMENNSKDEIFAGIQKTNK